MAAAEGARYTSAGWPGLRTTATIGASSGLACWQDSRSPSGIRPSRRVSSAVGNAVAVVAEGDAEGDGRAVWLTAADALGPGSPAVSRTIAPPTSADTTTATTTTAAAAAIRHHPGNAFHHGARMGERTGMTR